MKDDVAITGVGVVCALGKSRDEVATGARLGLRPFAPVRAFDASTFKVDLAAEAPDLDIAGRFGRRPAAHTSHTDQLALWAVADALAQADVTPSALASAGLYVGASSGGLLEMEPYSADIAAAPPATFSSYPIYATAVRLAHHFRILGPRATFMTACSSSAHALGLAMRRVRSGELPFAIAGGSESVCRLTLAGFGSLGVLDPGGTRPFGADRRGLTLGEGAAYFVLEPLAAAHRRGVEPLGILAGYGAAAEAHHMVHPREDGAGAVAAMTMALADAGINPVDIDYVNAHGTGTLQNDAMEARAVRALMGDRQSLRISSSKSMLGHTLGASGALEAAICLLGMTGNFTPPNAGVGVPAPELGNLALVREALPEAPRAVVSTSFAFGGNDAALVLLKPDADVARSSRHELDRSVVVSAGAAATAAGSASDPESLAALSEQALSGRHLQGLDAALVLGRGAVRRMDPLSAAATAVCTNAARTAGLVDCAQVGLSFATAFGALDGTASFIERLRLKGAHLVNPAEFPNLVHNAPAGHATIHLGAYGPSLAPNQEELAGDEALRVVWGFVCHGELDLAIAGGGDLHSPAIDLGYAKLARRGYPDAQFASTIGAVVLEAQVAAEARGHTPWARVLAVGDAGPWSGVEGAIGRALETLAASGQPLAGLDLWLTGATEAQGQAHEERALALPLLHDVPRLALRAALGGAPGAGPAAVAVAAALVFLGRARAVLVTAVTRDGAAQATLLGSVR